MPGYVIHLSVAEEYLRKHHKEKENYNEFIEGVIFPDSVTDKSLTHYGEKSSRTNLYKFLQNKKIDNSFDRGYFLHLLTDYLFYNKYVDVFSKDMYNDYDILNKILIKKYNVVLPEKIKQFVFYKDGLENLKILYLPLVEKFVEDVSNMQIDDISKKVIESPDEWTKIRPLKHTT